MHLRGSSFDHANRATESTDAGFNQGPDTNNRRRVALRVDAVPFGFSRYEVGSQRSDPFGCWRCRQRSFSSESAACVR